MRRIDDVSKAFGEITGIAIERKVDAVFCLGDLGDPDAGSILIRLYDTILKMAMRLNMMHIDLFMVAGNHDVIEDGSGLTTLHPLNQAGVRIFERPRLVDYRGCNIAFLPYPSRVTQYNPVDVVNSFADPKLKRVVMGHCTAVPGAKAGSESGDLARGGSFDFPLEACKAKGVIFMANGHFHHQQITPDGVHIPGSVEKFRFDEEYNIPGIFIVTI